VVVFCVVGWDFFVFLLVSFLKKNAYLDLGTVFNEAVGALDELQNPESLANVDTLDFETGLKATRPEG